MSTQEPIEPDQVEYYEPPAPRPAVESRTVIIEQRGLPCCPGCGCLAVVLVLVLVFHLSAVFTTLLLLVAAAWASASLLKAAGVSRFSPVYVYLMVPLFLTVANFASRFLRGYWAYSAGQIVFGTLLIYLFLWAVRGMALRRS